MAAAPMHLTIDVRVDADEISGEIHDGSGPGRPFLGWLGLIGALDGLLRIPSSTAEAPRPNARAWVALDESVQ
jgi:hypothetical protein